MSFENDPRIPENPVASVEPPRSRKKFWLLGGCGCLSLLALVCIGGGAVIWMSFVRPIMELNNESMELAKASPQVQELIGSPIEAGTPTQSGTDVPGEIVFRIPVSGDKGSGVVVIRYRIDTADGGFTTVREGMYLEHDGQHIDLDLDKVQDELTPPLDIDLGDEQ